MFGRGYLVGGMERGFAPFKKFSSLSPYEGERDKGRGVDKNLLVNTLTTFAAILDRR